MFFLRLAAFSFVLIMGCKTVKPKETSNIQDDPPLNEEAVSSASAVINIWSSGRSSSKPKPEPIFLTIFPALSPKAILLVIEDAEDNTSSSPSGASVDTTIACSKNEILSKYQTISA